MGVIAVRTRKRYDDKFRANAIVYLEAAGYPGKKGALEQVAKQLGCPAPTLHRWAKGKNNPPPSELVTEKKADLRELLENELRAIFKEMPEARGDAGYRDLGTVAGILFDKKQLLEGKPTEITQDVTLTDTERSTRVVTLLDKARARRAGLAIN